MAVQIVMDPTGDTRHEFNTADASALAEAERRFKQLTGAGFTAAARTADGRSELIRHFDPTARGPETRHHEQYLRARARG